MDDEQKREAKRAAIVFAVALMIDMSSSIIYVFAKDFYLVGIVVMVISSFYILLSVSNIKRAVPKLERWKKTLISLLGYFFTVVIALMHLSILTTKVFPIEWLANLSSSFVRYSFLFVIVVFVYLIYYLMYVDYKDEEFSLSKGKENIIFRTREIKPDPTIVKEPLKTRLSIAFIIVYIVASIDMMLFFIFTLPNSPLGSMDIQLYLLRAAALLVIMIVTFFTFTIYLYRIQKWYKKSGFLRDIVVTDKAIKILLRPDSESDGKVINSIKFDEIEEYNIDRFGGFLNIKTKTFSLHLFLNDSDMDKIVEVIERYKPVI